MNPLVIRWIISIAVVCLGIFIVVNKPVRIAVDGGDFYSRHDFTDSYIVRSNGDTLFMYARSGGGYALKLGKSGPFLEGVYDPKISFIKRK